MAKIIMLCGKICSGKTTFAKDYIKKNGGVLLSVDEIMLKIFGQHCGEMHDFYAEKIKFYLLEKSLELNSAGVDVILDWGFWKSEDRKAVRKYFFDKNIPVSLGYLNVSEENQEKYIEARNEKVMKNEAQAYFIDENLLNKFENLFEFPKENEVDFYI